MKKSKKSAGDNEMTGPDGKRLLSVSEIQNIAYEYAKQGKKESLLEDVSESQLGFFTDEMMEKLFNIKQDPDGDD